MPFLIQADTIELARKPKKPKKKKPTKKMKTKKPGIARRWWDGPGSD